MKLFLFLISFAALGFSTASSLLDEKRDLVCVLHTVLINLLTLNHGEEFCASYLNIQPSVVLTTSTVQTTTTQVLPAQTVTNIVTTGTEIATLTSFSTITQTDTVTILSTTVLVPQKRSIGLGSRALPIPSYLVGFPAPQISAACSCLNLLTPQVTSVTTATQTNTVVYTPPPVTSEVATFIVTTITTTLISTTTTTTTTTSVVTETPPRSTGCDLPQVLARGYDINFSRAFDATYLGSDVTLYDCCQSCWTAPNCFAWIYGGEPGSGTDGPDSCNFFVSTDQGLEAIANPPAVCPLGVDSRPQLVEVAQDQGFFGPGPCDLTGVQYT